VVVYIWWMSVSKQVAVTVLDVRGKKWELTLVDEGVKISAPIRIAPIPLADLQQALAELASS